MTYDAAFYEAIRDGTKDSAAVIAPLVYDLIQPQRVADIGCGEGWFAKAFEDLGCSVQGYEGEWAVGTGGVTRAGVPVEARDLACEGDFAECDLVVCLEVAEHLPPTRARSFVRDLCATAPVVLFSAAVPDQGGEGHLNEQWPAYWVECFRRHDFEVSDDLRWRIWDDDRVDSWYRQNLLIAVRRQEAPKLSLSLSPVAPVIHPAVWRDLMAFIHNMAQQGKIEWL